MSVYKKNDKYYCRFQVKGERHHYLCTGAKDKAEAQLLESQFMYRVQQEINGVKERKQKAITLNRICELYIIYAESSLRDLKHIRSHLKYIKQYFGENKNILDIRQKDIEAYKLYLIKSNKANATVNRYLGTLQKLFNIAIDNNLTQYNPVSRVKKLTEDNIELKYWSKEDEEKIFKIAPEWFRDILKVALQTGLRKTNIRLMEQSWIDFSEGLIKIPKTKNKGKKYIVLPLNDTLLDIFNKYKDNGTDYIFINKQRLAPHSDKFLDETLDRLCRQANVENIGFHGLRHTVGTRLAMNNVPVTVIKDFLAHSDVRTTMRYTHTVADEMKQAASVLNSY